MTPKQWRTVAKKCKDISVSMKRIDPSSYRIMALLMAFAESAAQAIEEDQP